MHDEVTFVGGMGGTEEAQGGRLNVNSNASLCMDSDAAINTLLREII